LVSLIISNNYTFAAEEYFSIKAKIDLTRIEDGEKLKVIAFANGHSQVKYIEIKDIKSKSISIPFTFEKSNDVVNVGLNDEYFVCAYNIQTKTGSMKSYSCYEGDIKNIDGKNSAKLGPFQPVSNDDNSDAKNVKINIFVLLSDRKNVQNIKVVAMDKGEFKTKSVNAAELLKKSKGDIIKFGFNFERQSEIGQIQKGDMYFACVSANELNPPEGTECEHKLTKKIGRENNLYAR
jgi:hypothetical protein